jgi:hypothetical protein
VVTAAGFTALGSPTGSLVSGPGIVSEVQSVPGGFAARILPEDAWISYSLSDSGLAGASTLEAGLPLPDGAQFVRIGREHSIRFGIAEGDRVTSAFEIRSSLALGEVALARPDGVGGFVLVVRVARPGPSPTDRFEVLRVTAAGEVSASTVPSHAFAESPPLARFRLDRHGHLFQLRTSPDGMRIVRYDLGVAS